MYLEALQSSDWVVNGVMGSLVDSLQCGCNPGKVYRTKITFDKHMFTDRHRGFALTLENKELRLQLAHAENKNRSLQHTIIELEKLKNPRRVTESVKKRVAAAQYWRCSLCHVCLPSSYQIDHILALRHGGSNDELNLQAVCPSCHAQKTQTEVSQNTDVHSIQLILT